MQADAPHEQVPTMRPPELRPKQPKGRWQGNQDWCTLSPEHHITADCTHGVVRIDAVRSHVRSSSVAMLRDAGEGSLASLKPGCEIVVRDRPATKYLVLEFVTDLPIGYHW